MDPKQIIERLRPEYVADDYAFALRCSFVIGGDKNKKARVAIMEELTGEKLPARDCSLSKVASVIKASLEQLTLFEV